MTGQRNGFRVPALAYRGTETGGPCGDLGIQVVEPGDGEAAGFLPGMCPEPLTLGQGRQIRGQRDVPADAVVLVLPGTRGVAAQELVRAAAQPGHLRGHQAVITHAHGWPGVCRAVRSTAAGSPAWSRAAATRPAR